ncbi:MAG: ECF transporter S component [Candidatus Zixiibacteriota bacterium]|nr:MAG: ECF transporter S component [candidate division Zixibacteria bacterium]
MSFSARKLALMGVLIALAIALKLPILSVPNVEFFTFIVFSSGYLLGMIGGAVVGVIAMSIYTSFVTPYGFPPLPIALAQVLSMALIGFAGGLVFRLDRSAFRPDFSSRTIGVILTMGISGLALTLFYDLLTNLATALVVGQFWPVMVAAVPFSLLHIVSNVVIFVVLSPLLLKMARFHREKV